jgi:striatin 1/3/4
MPEAGKDFPLLNGLSMMSGPSVPSASGNQIPSLERSNPLGSGGMMHAQHQQGMGHQQLQLHNQQSDKDKDGDEPRQLTAIFRPDEAGEWKERLRLSHEAEQARQAGAASWDRREDDDGKDEEGEVEEEDSSVVGEGEGTKVWKAKRTLRKLVHIFHLSCKRTLIFISVTWMPCAHLHSTRMSYVSQRVEMIVLSKFGEWTLLVSRRLRMLRLF